MLEPDPDAVTSMHRLDAALADRLRNPSFRSPAGPPGSVRTPAPVQVGDFAFADTVFAVELPGDEPPPSGPIYVNDESGETQCMTPLAYPLPSRFPPPALLPAARDEAALPTRLRALEAHLRQTVRRSRGEMRELWASTAEMVDGEGAHGLGASSLPLVLRRVVALWSCFQWSRADLTRAALIGLAVFVAAAAFGGVTIHLGEAAAASSEVRAGRTLDQHTGKKIEVRGKR